MIRLCLIINTPITFSILFYARDIMGIFGKGYVEGWIQLDILLLSVFPVTITGFMTILAYSYGKYRESLLIGIALTLPRVLLYVLLVPFYGAEGASAELPCRFMDRSGTCFPILKKYTSTIELERIPYHLINSVACVIHIEQLAPPCSDRNIGIFVNYIYFILVLKNP